MAELRAVSASIEAAADAAARDIDEFNGQQSVRSGEAAGFDTMATARFSEQSWQYAVEIIGAKLAVAADKLSLSVDTYALVEQQNVGHFQSSR
ncbi:MAG: hypothetical protein JO287_13840 [Pseudonocardiales bacterium]|nr:hypothetical protein [Pseudonocardiales bacterium]